MLWIYFISKFSFSSVIYIYLFHFINPLFYWPVLLFHLQLSHHGNRSALHRDAELKNNRSTLSLSILFLRPSWALACSPTRMTSRVASWMGISERWSPLPISSSNLSTRGDPRNIKEQDSGTWIIWPFNSITWQTEQSMRGGLRKVRPFLEFLYGQRVKVSGFVSHTPLYRYVICVFLFIGPVVRYSTYHFT